MNLTRPLLNYSSQVKRIALVGASAKPERPSHRVMQFLLDEGYEVIPINPGLAGQKLLGQTVHASLADLPTSVDMADIFRDAASLPEVTQEVVDAGIPAMWTQLGVVHSEAERTAVDAGLQWWWTAAQRSRYRDCATQG